MPPDTKILRWYAATAIIDAPDVAGSPPSSGSAHRAKLGTPYVPVNTSGSATSLAPSTAAASTSERARVRLSAMSSETSSWRRPRGGRAAACEARRRAPCRARACARRHASAYWWRRRRRRRCRPRRELTTREVDARSHMLRRVGRLAATRAAHFHLLRAPSLVAVRSADCSRRPCRPPPRQHQRRPRPVERWIPGWKGSLFGRSSARGCTACG